MEPLRIMVAVTFHRSNALPAAQPTASQH